MPVLLLAQGDAQAKDLLRRVIEARYGVSPPAIDHIRLGFRGKVRTRVGPITTAVPLDVSAYFRFPSGIRWDFNVRPVGVSVQRGAEAFDGEIYRRIRGGGLTGVIDDTALVGSLQRRLWAMAGTLLTPLGEHFVKLNALGESSLKATNTLINDAVRLTIRSDFTVERVEIRCLNPDNATEQLFSLRLSEEQKPVDGLMLPARISAYWDNVAYFEVTPVGAENEVNLPDSVFTLSDTATQ
jgi:hypothetical protein